MLVMFPMNQENGQILRTKRWLYEALGALLQEMPFSDITVGHICKRAYVSRSVFYNHYENKESLLFEVFRRIAAVYWTKAKLSTPKEGRLHTRTAYTILCQELMRSRSFFHALHRDGYSWLLEDFFKRSYENFFLLPELPDEPDIQNFREHFISYHATALTALLLRWLDEPDPQPPEQMAELTIRLLFTTNVEEFLQPVEEKKFLAKGYPLAKLGNPAWAPPASNIQ